MGKKKILFIIPWLPYPIKSGGHLALFSGIKAVANDLEVYIAFEARNDEEYLSHRDHFLQLFPNIHLLPLLHSKNEFQEQSFLKSIIYKAKVSIWNFLHRKSSSNFFNLDSESKITHFWEANIQPRKKVWQAHLAKLFDQYCFDIIQVEMPSYISLILNLPQNALKVYVHHELGFVKREHEMYNYGFHNNQYVNNYKKYIDLIEINLLNQYDCIISLSKIDAKKMEKNGVIKPVFPSFVAIENHILSDYQPCDGKQLVFVGPDGHYPNFLGLTWFLDNCWESLLMKDSRYHLKIIGNWKHEHIMEYEKKYNHIHFTGYVENLKEELKGSIMIIPITIGSGIRIKILEACSNGIPFVSTTIGAEGIPVVNDVHCYIADQKETFIDSIFKLQDEEVQKRFVHNSKQMIFENYSLDALRKNRLSVYNIMQSE